MSLFKVSRVRVSAVSACVPKTIVPVADYPLFSAQELDTFRKMTGVERRRFANKGTCASDLCFQAANHMLENKAFNVDEIDVLIFVSQSPDYFLPATSVTLQRRLGLGKNVMAFDINLGCSGFVYGLSVMASLLSMPGMRKGLLLCGDVSSPSLSEEDKSSYPLFGDAGTATLVCHDESANPMCFHNQSDGSGFESIIIPDGGTRCPLTPESYIREQVSDGIKRSRKELHLNGVDVFNFALREVKPNVSELLNLAQKQAESIDYFVMHQANWMMNEAVRKKCGFTTEQTPYSLQDYGNTSSASIPLTISAQLSSNTTGIKTWLMSGFGVGLSWGSVYLETHDLKVFQIIEHG